MIQVLNKLPWCTEDETLELMLLCEDGQYSLAAHDYQKVIAKHPAFHATAQWTITECIYRLSDYYRKHFSPKTDK